MKWLTCMHLLQLYCDFHLINGFMFNNYKYFYVAFCPLKNNHKYKSVPNACNIWMRRSAQLCSLLYNFCNFLLLVYALVDHPVTNLRNQFTYQLMSLIIEACFIEYVLCFMFYVNIFNWSFVMPWFVVCDSCFYYFYLKPINK